MRSGASPAPWLLGRLILQDAENDRPTRAAIDEVLRIARKLESEDVGFARSWSLLLTAGAERQCGRIDAARRALEAAVAEWVRPRHCSYPLAIAPPTDCSPPDDWEHIDRDFWGGGVSGALDLLVGPVFAGIQGGAHLPLAGHDIVPIPFVGVRIGARFRLWTPDETHVNRERTATRSP